MDQHASTTVLVTGISGFVALHCALELLRRGYRVRGTVRSLERADSVRTILAQHAGDVAGDSGNRLDIVAADLTSDAGWSEAVAGCTYVLHVASPLPARLPRHENDLIVPARDGTLRVLGAAAAAGVRRVVMTSSVAAVIYGHERDGSRTYDESDWSNLKKKRIAPYPKSKTLAERAAWEFVESLGSDSTLELAVINPGLILGPVLGPDSSTSGEVVRKLLAGEAPGCPALGWAPVDVRDVASAHVEAMTVPEAAGKRFICATEHAWMSDIAAILDKHYSPRGYPVPTRALPASAVRLAALFDRTIRMTLFDLGKREDVSSERARAVLGWKPRSLEEMVVDMAESMIQHGIVAAPKKARA